MIKKIRNWVKDKAGVSPIIAIILMVAITVVLAATIYVWVSGMGKTGGGATALSATTWVDGNSYIHLRVDGGKATAGNLKIRIYNDTKSSGWMEITDGAAYDASGDNGKYNNSHYFAIDVTQENTNYLQAGDEIKIGGAKSDAAPTVGLPSGDWTIEIKDVQSNSMVYHTTVTV